MNVSDIVNTREIEKAVLSVSEHLEAKQDCSTHWSDMTEERLWCELVSCILGSRTLYETAKACASHLSRNGLLDSSAIVENPKESENRLVRELSKAIYPPFRGSNGRAYRYPRSRSHYIVRTAVRIYEESDTELGVILCQSRDGSEAREVLRSKAIGIGYKQASLFLRNISHSGNLAILDSHVLKYMRLMNLISGDVLGPNLSRKSIYMNLERILQDYATSKDKPLSILDLAMWIVMRLVEREFVIWRR